MSKIKALVMDVDGTLTDGKVYMSHSGELMKAFNIKDGYIIARLSDYGIVPIIITGRSSTILSNRCKELDIVEVYQGVSNKLTVLKEVLTKLSIHPKEAAYIGDDENDLECIYYCGLSACPCDAVNSVRKSVDYISKHNGGEGAVRDFLEYIISINGSFDKANL